MSQSLCLEQPLLIPMPSSISIKVFKASFHGTSVGLPILLGKMHSYYLLVDLPQFCGETVLSWMVLQLLSPGLGQVLWWLWQDGLTHSLVPWRGRLEGRHSSVSSCGLFMWLGILYVVAVFAQVQNCHVFWRLGSIPMNGSNKAITSALFHVVKTSHRTTPGGIKCLAWVWEGRWWKECLFLATARLDFLTGSS